MAGSRQGQVHLTLSRCGLRDGFNHYLEYGSEFDQQVAQHIFGAEGKELLRRDGSATIIKVEVPGDKALTAVNRFFSVDDFLARGEVPGLVNQFLSAWSYALAYPAFHSATQHIDCGLVFPSIVSPEWIVAVDTLNL